jgi:spore germination cell wall hydrolase CwlJ-like protein
LIKSFSRRGVAAAIFMAITLVGGSSEALGQNAPALERLIAAQPPQVIMTAFNPAIRSAAAVAAPKAPASLGQMVEQYAAGPALDEQQRCLATAVYFESMGEPLEGQLAVARVVINRASSGRYPTDWCGVVKQKAQFSFVRAGRFPSIDPACAAWRKAQAIARIAVANASASLPTDVLWYHADYVAPAWGRRLTRVEKIGAHIFYRS